MESMKQQNLISDVAEFMRRTQLPHPTHPTTKEVQYRAKHVIEEANEFQDWFELLQSRIARHGNDPENELVLEAWEKVLDGLVDLVYVAIGAAHGLGLSQAFYEAWEEVQRANLAKAVERSCPVCNGDDSGPAAERATRPCATCNSTGIVYQVVKNYTGKVVKPVGWTPPDLRSIILRSFKQ